MRNTPLKAFTKSPLKDEGVGKKVVKAIKKDFKDNDPFPNVAIGKDVAEATKKSLKKQAKGQTVGFRKL